MNRVVEEKLETVATIHVVDAEVNSTTGLPFGRNDPVVRYVGRRPEVTWVASWPLFDASVQVSTRAASAGNVWNSSAFHQPRRPGTTDGTGSRVASSPQLLRASSRVPYRRNSSW